MIEISSEPVFLTGTKKCNCCGNLYIQIPSGARFLDNCDPLGGWYWECSCGSTLFVPAKDLKVVA